MRGAILEPFKSFQHKPEHIDELKKVKVFCGLFLVVNTSTIYGVAQK